MASHVVRIAALTALALFCTFYPYLPGDFDGVAVGLSMMAQVGAVLGAGLVLIGLLWLAHELRARGARQRESPIRPRAYRYALASLIVGTLVALGGALGAATSGFALGIVVLVLWGYALSRLIPRLRRLKNPEPQAFNPMPLYLVIVPTVTLLTQLTLADTVTEWGKERAIASSAELVNEIERFYTARGHYPRTLSGLWPDYKTSVIGIPQFHYSPTATSYSVFFELPMFLVRAPGARVIVMYNPRDEHLIPSHAAWHLTRTPESLSRAQGWFSVRDAPRPHWKSFLFD